jgi:PAS domain S-box-containing protein
MLHAFNYRFPATTEIGEAARKRLLERFPKGIEIDAEFLDLARNGDPAYESRLVTLIQDKYAKNPPDLIIALGSLGLPFVLRHRDDIAPNVPVVFTGISAQTYTASLLPPDVTGIITNFDLEKTLELAERLQPQARRLFLIAGSGETDRRWQSVARKVVQDRRRQFETTFLFELSYENLLAELSRVPHDAVVIILTVFADSEGRSFVPAEVAGELSAVSPAPVYAPYDTYLGRGTVGGFVESFESAGSAAADMALEILSRKEGAALPSPRTNPGQTYRVDHRAMERWKLRESDLPPGTEVLFKQPTIWEQHLGAVLAAIFVVGSQAVVLSALLLQRRRRRRAEDLLKQSEERMTFAAASANIGLWQLDRNANELWATEHCREMFGLPRDKPLTRNALLAAIHPDDLGIVTSSLQEKSDGEQRSVSDVRVVFPNDKVRWFRMRARSYPESGGGPSQTSGIFLDVTDLKSAEAEAALQRQEVAHLMRVSLLGELSGSIAHEINQPLTAILSNAQAALHMTEIGAPNLSEIREALQDIIEEDNRASEVIQRLRNLLKKGERKSERIDVDELINSTLSLVNSELISREVHVNFKQGRTALVTSGDPIQLQQVVLNLITNAMDAMIATPTVRRLMLISTRQNDDGDVEVEVRDRGHGIPPTTNGRLFEPFYTTKDHGLGLGLTICSTIIHAHGGILTVVNDEDGGAVARFTLPAQDVRVA